jgi:hypothetical protein
LFLLPCKTQVNRGAGDLKITAQKGQSLYSGQLVKKLYHASVIRKCMAAIIENTPRYA